jgi:UDP-2,3-diacylglucosamine pyrophosphatase LpxH
MHNIIDTLIISDLHLGSSISEATKLLAFLKKTKFKRLILLGDMFADLNFSRLKSDHWEVLSYLRKLSNEKTGIEVIWVYGNHDLGIVEVLSHLVGINVFDKYVWNVDNKRCIAMHGHQFDPAISKHKNVSEIISWWYLQIQKIPGFKIFLPRWLDFVTAYFQNLSEVIEKKAIIYAKLHGYDIVCCGHTHEAIHTTKNGIDYYNSGCWVKEESTYISFKGSEITINRVG